MRKTVIILPMGMTILTLLTGCSSPAQTQSQIKISSSSKPMVVQGEFVGAEAENEENSSSSSSSNNPKSSTSETSATDTDDKESKVDNLENNSAKSTTAVDKVKAASSATVPNTSATGAAPAPNQNVKPLYYVIESGDGAYLIANKFNVDWSQIVEWNSSLDPNNIGFWLDGSCLQIGQSLIVGYQ